MTAQLDPERLPPITAALVLETIGLEVFRNQFGMTACLTRSVGPRRMLLGPIAEAPRSFAPDPVEMARDGARQMLAGLCETCPHGHCKMKHWGMA